MFYYRRMHYADEEEPEGNHCGFGRGYGFGHGFRHLREDDKAHLEFVKKELELRLEYLSKEITDHPDDPELNFAKREIENKITYVSDLIAKAQK